MIGSKVTQRRQARVDSIVEAAWALAREHGIAGVSLHAVARAVGMRQPSLYEYFESKHALFDTMFAEGNRQLVDRLEQLPPTDDPRAALQACLRTFADFAVEDPARYELLFLRRIPGFEPTPAAYELARQALAHVVARLHDCGVDDQGDVDCVVAMTAGLVDAQLTNEPGTTRWTRHLERLADLLVEDAITRQTTGEKGR